MQAHQARVGEHPEVLRDGGARNAKMRSNFASGEFSGLYKPQDLSAVGFGNSIQHSVHHGYILAHAYVSVN